jgi:N-methylhydantoinase B/oxoprolinase/acetone carboxylase alpha subunit
LREIATRYGHARVARYATAVQDYAERVLRRTIETIPDGEYHFEDALDNDGFSDAPVRIRARIRIAGDSAEVDFTGSDPQTAGGVNANLAITTSATLYAFRCLVEDDVLYNSGIARPYGSSRRPAPSSMRSIHPRSQAAMSRPPSASPTLSSALSHAPCLTSSLPPVRER